ncbi:MAG TPA: glycosyltransferase family 4 protein [Xanthobacteraceae bacterium]|nr:glycosyltransferase family 4 protein [Xanthobacteraceae bacterium]
MLRAPVGGLFRHVLDLARGQAARGHRVGIIADALTGGSRAEAALGELAPRLALGVSRVPMSRQIGLQDVAAVAHVGRRAADVAADVLHGHGAKGGAYARLARCRSAIRVYTPHGGSLHFGWGSPTGFLYLTLERVLITRTDLFLFESAYGRDAFRAKIGDAGAMASVVHNGVTPAEFAPVTPDAQATDLVFVGELRVLKGVDVLIQAIALLAPDGRGLRATIVGEGPDRTAFEAQVRAQGLAERVQFVGAKPAREAFALGWLLVIPSRAESLPYIVLEAAAAGVPLITTKVGGIPEIFGADSAALVPPGDPAALARAIDLALRDPDAKRDADLRLQARVREIFSSDAMTDAVLAAYRTASACHHG